MFKRMSITLVLVLLVSSLLAACGGGAPAPVTFSSLPMFTGASESTNELLVGILGPMVDAMKAESAIKTVEGKAYDVPEGTTWDAVSSFYKAALEKGGWTSLQTGADNAAFTRGTQTFVIKYSDGVGLIAVLAEAK